MRLAAVKHPYPGWTINCGSPPHECRFREHRRHEPYPPGRAPAPQDPGRGHRPAASAGRGHAAAHRVRVRPAAQLYPLGAAGHGQDHDRAADGRCVRCAVHHHQRRAGRREGYPRGGRAGADRAGDPGQRRPAHHRLRRRGAPLQQEPAGRLLAPCRVGPVHLHRRDHREPLVRGQLRPLVARRGLCAAAAVAGRPGTNRRQGPADSSDTSY